MIVAIVPARSGSKGFPNKNIALVEGQTLIEHAVSVALKSKSISKVLISTDSEQYQKIALCKGAESLGLRSDNLSSDNAKTIDVVLDILRKPSMQTCTHVVLLQPTSPIRTASMLDECIKRAIDSGESVTTISKIEDPHPVKIKRLDNGAIKPYLHGGNSEVSRQELPDAFELTGAVYVSSVENIFDNNSLFSENTVPYESDCFVNIDSEKDYQYLQFLLEKGLVALET